MQLQLKKEKHMIDRYSDPRITEIWSLEQKFQLWQTVELAVIEARELLEMIPLGTFSAIASVLDNNPISIEFIDEREKVLWHDLNAFIDERLRFMKDKPELQAEFHRNMTSYDTEEAAFAMNLQKSLDVVLPEARMLLKALKKQAIKYRYTPMSARTHGQEAEMQSFGKRCLAWYVELEVAVGAIVKSQDNLSFSKLSGAIGTNSGIDPALEETALKILGFERFVGATQIMPRVLYSPIASALADLVMVVDKIANDIRLGARSGNPLWHEPFGKQQKGSSAMPHKKNTIVTEQIEGMARMARNYAAGIQENIKTWEERSIEQSSVERVSWPDLFHVTIRTIGNLTKVINGLVVYPDHMLSELVMLRGCYASNEAKETLLELGTPFGLIREEAYRIVQLACFNVFEPKEAGIKNIRENPPGSLDDADGSLRSIRSIVLERNMGKHLLSIEVVIKNAELHTSPQLEASEQTVEQWNGKLRSIFNQSFPDHWAKWGEIFRPSHILANEVDLFKRTFGI